MSDREEKRCCKCGKEPARPNQRTGRNCHAEEMRVNREKKSALRRAEREQRQSAWRLELLKWRPLTTRTGLVATFYHGTT